MLDFLYPVKAMTSCLHRISIATLESRQAPGSLCRSGSGWRSYSSAASVAQDGLTEATAAQECSGIPESVAASTASRVLPESEPVSAVESPAEASNKLKTLLQSGETDGFDEVWRLFGLSEDKDRSQVLQYLIRSRREVDRDRVLEVFKQLAVEQRKAIDYRCAITACLARHRRTVAINIHREALAKSYDTSCGSDLLFAQLFRDQYWSAAARVWHTDKLHAQSHGGDIFQSFLWSRACEDRFFYRHIQTLLAFVDRRSVHFRSERERKFIKCCRLMAFAAAMQYIKRVRTRTEFKRLVRLFRRLRTIDRISVGVYAFAISTLTKAKMPRLAIKFYLELRRRGEQISHLPLLAHMVENFAACGDVEGVRDVVDAMARCRDGRPAAGDLQKAMMFFASRGEADTVERIYSLIEDWHRQQSRDLQYIRPILKAYARGGRVEEARAFMEDMPRRFGVGPDRRCWNILIYGYGQARDVEGASACFDELCRGLGPDEYSYGTLMLMHAARGDVDRVEELHEAAVEGGVKASGAIADARVLARVEDGDVQGAEAVAEEAMGAEAEESRRRWNMVLRGHAQRADVTAVQRVQKRMRKLRLKADEYTYSARMRCLAEVGQPNRALEYIRHVMRRRRLPVTASQYAIVMRGFLATNEPERATWLYNRMLRVKVAPNAETDLALLRASAHRRRVDPLSGEAVPGADEAAAALERAERTLERLFERKGWLETGTEADGAVAGAGAGAGADELAMEQDDPAAFVELLIYRYGQQGAFEKAQQMHESYLNLVESRRGARSVAGPPLRLVGALMAVAYREGRHEDVVRYWQTARDQAAKEARRWHAANTDEAGWVLPARRHLLCEPLTYALKALQAMGRIDETQATVERMERDGYRLERKNWNVYVQGLAEAGWLEEGMAVCESRLMEGWRGWPLQRQRMGLRPVRSTSTTMAVMRPNYHTLVLLSRALIRRRVAASQEGQEAGLMERLVRECPATMEALDSMSDGLDQQKAILVQAIP